MQFLLCSLLPLSKLVGNSLFRMQLHFLKNETFPASASIVHRSQVFVYSLSEELT